VVEGGKMRREAKRLKAESSKLKEIATDIPKLGGNGVRN